MDEPIEISKQIIKRDMKPLVTISCTTYNQERYISKALDSFLLQKTSFPVEIIIYDDASTDRTPEILKYYKKRFPSLMKLNLQTENQFSKGINVNISNFQAARGRFIALCHGDDYWTDPNKLAKQVDAMIRHDVDISGHPARCIDVSDHDLGKNTGFIVEEQTTLSPTTLLKNSGNMLPFGSIMINEEAKLRTLDNMPPVRFHTGIQMLGAYDKGVLILPDLMSVYRVDVPGSTTEILIKDVKRAEHTTSLRIKSFRHLQYLYGARYENDFLKLLSGQIINLIWISLSAGKREAIDILKAEGVINRFKLLTYFIKGIGERIVYSLYSRLKKLR